MVSIAVPGGSTPRRAFHDAVDWGRVVVGTLARGVVATVLGLALWAAAPALIGWQPTTVMTGSMEPRLVPGDVVVSRPVPSAEVRPGRILLADDPDQPGHLRMHRYVEDGPRGTLVTKGDANPQADSTPLEPEAVHGVAFLRIPFVAAPITWLREGEWVRLVLLGLGFAAVLALCAVDGSLRRFAAGDDADGDDADGDGVGGEPTDSADGPARPGDGLEARGGPAPSLPSGGGTTVTRRSLRRHHRRIRRVRRLGGGTAVVVLAVGLGTLLSPPAVAAPFSRTTSAASTYGAATAASVLTLTCTPATSNTVTIAWTYPTGIGTPNSFDLLNGTTQVATAPGAASSLVYQGSGLLDLGTTYTLHLRTNLGGSWTTVSTPTVRVKVASLLGITSATCA
ncbi:S24/S26 family peptidase [Curtobacterium sp. NPDC089689]|uniref:S24/S26 family peptidase n=1 Tax=Curtobacterium sp. NPDC089689 TaxID=3363968 RepID=UPI0038234636